MKTKTLPTPRKKNATKVASTKTKSVVKATIKAEPVVEIPLELIVPIQRINKRNGKTISPDDAHYVNAKQLTAEVDKYAKECRAAAESGKPKPRMNNYIGESIMKIAGGLTKKSNFSGYTFKDDMECGAIENCVRYADRFNIDKAGSSGAFSYFSMIIWNHCLRKIQEENKHNAIKFRCIENAIQNDHEHDYHKNPDSDAYADLRKSLVPVHYNPRKRKDKKEVPVLGLDI